jgi:prevent-host-death family protein
MPERPVSDARTIDVRDHLADHINAAQTRGAVVFLTSRGRRVAALVPVAVADGATDASPSKRLLSEILAIVNRHEGRNAEQAMAEIHAACLASLDRASDQATA